MQKKSGKMLFLEHYQNSSLTDSNPIDTHSIFQEYVYQE